MIHPNQISSFSRECVSADRVRSKLPLSPVHSSPRAARLRRALCRLEVSKSARGCRGMRLALAREVSAVRFFSRGPRRLAASAVWAGANGFYWRNAKYLPARLGSRRRREALSGHPTARRSLRVFSMYTPGFDQQSAGSRGDDVKPASSPATVRWRFPWRVLLLVLDPSL